ncbi:Uma2 family endonuclease [Geminocystis sp. CENA526]|uniref:Uma2 family endonuclease n=1 Tax=Geminocystis sp. CENA526 TaxID=1355871 RepID=UPI003D6FCE4A
MVAIAEIKSQITLKEFLTLPETKPYNEYLNGKIQQKPMPQGEHSTLQTRLVTVINEVALPKKLAHAFTELRCTFAGSSIVPDISVFTWERIPKTEKGRIANRFEIAPDWAIEILSPEQSANKVIKKIMFCMSKGSQIGWLIDPEDESVMIFKPNQFPEMKSEDNILPVLNSLQELQLSVQEMFTWLDIN